MDYEKNCFLIDTVREATVTKTHFWDLSCNSFYNLVSNSSKLLQEICSSQKYKASAQEEEPTPTSARNV
jgi:hypothetical protein